ncbi:DUF4781 domain-containing protein [Methylobacterium sp. SD21]|uniref:DUF4781 domain-containing protein n=1 Tax=Methylobacterium litchii TaxID=3138810 RepID=UPI00313A9F39
MSNQAEIYLPDRYDPRPAQPADPPKTQPTFDPSGSQTAQPPAPAPAPAEAGGAQGSSSDAVQELLRTARDPKTTPHQLMSLMKKDGPEIADSFARLLTSSSEYMKTEQPPLVVSESSLLGRVLGSVAVEQDPACTRFVQSVLTTAPASAYKDGTTLIAMADILATRVHPNKSDFYMDKIGTVFESNYAFAIKILGTPDLVPSFSALISPETTLEKLRTVIEAAPPEAAGKFGTFVGQHSDFLLQLSKSFDKTNTTGINRASPDESPIARVLNALKDGPPSKSRSQFVTEVFKETTAFAIREPAVQTAMADATAAEWYPSNEKDADKAPEAAKRLADIFATDQGRGMLFVGDKYGPTSEDRLFGLAFLRNHPDITGKTLSQSEHGWTSPAVVTPYAQLAANQYLALRSDIPVAMKGFDLENTIGFALNLKLDVSEKDNIKDLKTKLANGEINCYANSGAAKNIQDIADQIRSVAGNGSVRVTVLPVTFACDNAQPHTVPLFRVLDEHNEERYVDEMGRQYDNFEDWRKHNILPPGDQYFPHDGHLTTGDNNEAVLDHAATSRTIDTTGEKVLHFLDRAAVIGGLFAGGLGLVASGAFVLPLMAASTLGGLWTGIESGRQLGDRYEHGQSINPFTSRVATNLWLNLGAGAASVLALGSAARLTQLKEAAEEAVGAEQMMHTAIKWGSFTTTAAQTVDQTVETGLKWKTMTNTERMYSLLKTCFFGVTAFQRFTDIKVGDVVSEYSYNILRTYILRTSTPEVIPDEALPPGEVIIELEPETNVVQGVRSGPGATQGEIELASNLAMGLRRINAMEEELGEIVPDGGRFPPGSIGRVVQDNVSNLNENLLAQLKKLQETNLSPQQRSQVEQDVSDGLEQLEKLEYQYIKWNSDPDSANRQATQGEIEDLSEGSDTTSYHSARSEPAQSSDDSDAADAPSIESGTGNQGIFEAGG